MDCLTVFFGLIFFVGLQLVADHMLFKLRGKAQPDDPSTNDGKNRQVITSEDDGRAWFVIDRSKGRSKTNSSRTKKFF